MISHKIIEKIIMALNSNNRKPKNIWLYGEAGLGKSETVRQVADILGLDFYTMSLSAQTTVFKLTGFLDANSNYRPTPLRLAYENGGLICLEECDTVNSGILAEINNILSQDIYSFPDKTVSRHKDFRLVCCANSNGKDNDIKYNKTQQIDASTLDRFIFIKMDLDEDLAKYLTNNDNWFNRVMKFREVVRSVCGDEIIVGMRAMIDGADLLESGFSQDEVENMVIYKGIDSDTVESIKAKMDNKVIGDKIELKMETINERDKWETKFGDKSDLEEKLEEDIIILKDKNGSECGYFDSDFAKKNPAVIEDIKRIIC